MTLRLRLVVATVILVAAGLALFGAATYTLDSRAAYQRLDAQVRSAAPLVDPELDRAAGLTVQPDLHGRGGPGDGGAATTPVYVPPGTYAELRDPSGRLLSQIPATTTSARPHFPSPLPVAARQGRIFTVGSTNGGGSFRALATTAGAAAGAVNGAVDGAVDGGTVLVALPATEVTNALHRLVLIETGGAILLLIALSAGSWLILRRGLRPLERMAGTARSISAGDLSPRVTPSGGNSEVGQLGLALNTMLKDIEAAFGERDATELRLRQFLADASHELRTPLTSIQGFAELFRISGDHARVDLPTVLRRIEEESARMKVLVEDLLLLARLDQPRATERTPVDLAVLAADACSDAVATAPDRSVTLDAPEPVVIAGDEALLRQAVANLVTNAVRHTPPGTSIEVGAKLRSGAAVVSVRDHGGGLDGEVLAHAFDRFWQADKARVGTGAGLGLAIVSSIAAEHGGIASVANAPGGGAEFTIRVPIALADAARQLSDASQSGPRVL